MGFWSKIFGRKKKTAPSGNGSRGTSAATVTATPPSASEADLNPQCAALTAGGSQCRRRAREGSKYCSSHKGYRPPAANVATSAADTKPTVKGAKDTAPTARGTSTSDAAVRPQCGAITADGGQCSRAARQASKYCGIHKGYRPPTASVAAKAKDTKPSAARSRDTAPSGRRAHVSHNGYKLYQKGNRYFFSKKSQTEAKAGGADPVYEMPADRTVTETPNGLPILKKA